MINASKDYLKSIYTGNIQYEVPFFQRPYVWDSENWDVLWESLEQVFRDYKSNIKSEHFIGTLIIKQKQAEHIGENKYDLIDGQQRITTFAILLKSLADTSKGELSKLKEKLLELVVFEDSRGNRFIRLIHNKIDKPHFESIMYNSEDTDTNENNNKLLNCYKYFLDKVEDLNDEDRDIYMNIILNKVPIISMLISAEDDEQEIFDTINSLGVKLTTAELLKNYIFKNKELQQLYEPLWKSTFEENEEQINFWNKDKTSGRIIRTNIEILLYCYLIIQTQKDVKLEKLYKEYKSWLKDSSTEEKINFLETLKSYAEIYFQFPDGEELNEFSYMESEKLFFHIIENLSITTVYPLILYLYKEVENASLLAQHIKFLESYLVRRNICKYTTKNYNNLFLSILQKLKKIKETKDSIPLDDLMDIFNEFDDQTNVFPDDLTFAMAFYSSVLSNQNSKEILYCLALYQKSTGLNDVSNLSSSSFSVEHIMPKKWEREWMEPNMSETDKINRSRILLTIGNLTLVTKRLNSKLQNDTWENKKDHFMQYSSLAITTNYLGIEKWDEVVIRDRANDLCKLAMILWKR